MAEESAKTRDEITINVKGPSELKLQVEISPSKLVSELKEAIASKSDVEKDRQRLIYSGKVLKDEETISTYKIQTGHTIHMVKGAAKAAAPPASTSATGTSQRLPQMGTGLNVAGNLTDSVENIHHGLAGFNPFAGMQGINNLQDPNAMAGMMQSPEFLRSMSDMMSRPEIVDQIVAANPQLRGMGPQIREMMNNPMVREMMSNPESLRMMMQMQAAMEGGGGGMGGMGGMGGLAGLMGGRGGQPGAGAGAGAGAAGGTTNDPFPNLFAAQPAAPAAGGAAPGSPPAGGAAAAANPFAALFGPGGGMGGFGAGAGAGGAGGQNPFAVLFGPGGAGAGGLGGLGGFGFPPAAAAPQDTRAPEEIYATQLGQLNAMGLWDAQKNITALRRTGGNVEAAIELIFSGQLG